MNVGFISTRLAGIDGVSLETAKWATVLQRMGHRVFYCAGELDAGGPQGTLIAELHFRDPEATAIRECAFGTTVPDETLTNHIASQAARLGEGLQAFIDEYEIDLIIPENVFAIPLQIPLAIALRDIIADAGIPTIAHHHDFYWERDRFIINRIPRILEGAFPPDLPSIRHVVINSLAEHDLKARRGIDAVRLVPNVFDFATPPPTIDDFAADFRTDIGLGDEDVLILQPTRVVPRKGIELAIELVSELRIRNCSVVITHEAGDEGFDYLEKLQTLALQEGVDLHYVADHIGPVRKLHNNRKVYSIWDAYPHAALVTYPSLWEGFGNALLEAVYFKKPLLVNRYPVYEADIRPKGFAFIETYGQLTEETVRQVREAITDRNQWREIVQSNFDIGQKHYSYEVLEDHLTAVLDHF